MKNYPPLTLKWLFFSFKGRIARQSFILAQLFLLIVLIFLTYQIVLIDNDNHPRSIMWALALLVALIISAFSSLALGVKRLHDLNLPWLLVLIIFVPYINTLFILYLMIKSSYPKANDHGRPPFGKAK